jgi:integrase
MTPPKTGAKEAFDTILPSFGLRVFASGKASYFVFYRDAGGKQRRHTIGSTADIPSIAVARAKARALFDDIAAGRDVDRDRREERDMRRLTFGEYAAKFVTLYVRQHNKNPIKTERMIRFYLLPRWGNRRVSAITRDDVNSLLDELIIEGHPVTANRVLALVRKLFNWAKTRGEIDINPAEGIAAPGKETERERVLSDDEVADLWSAADRDGGVAGRLVKLLLLTGQRRGEVATMKWADIDLASGTWLIPQARTKAGRTHEVPLSPLALDVLNATPRLAGSEYVLPARIGTGPVNGLPSMKERIDKLTDVQGWRWHDLRRTAATGMAKLGVAGSTISKILNHAEGGVTRLYNRYSYGDEKRAALTRWADHVAGIVDPGRTGGNVVRLRA